ncbi:MAG: hypothetical protein ACHQ51_12295 [Elusimicrobiota bacterium]
MPPSTDALQDLRAARGLTQQAAKQLRDLQTRPRAVGGATLEKQKAAVLQELAARKETESRILAALLRQKTPQDIVALLDQPAAALIVLLPVRMETKFCGQAGQRTLRIRVFPDELEVETHEERLTLQEYGALKQYWQRLWMAGQDDAQESRKRFAWKSLCDLYGPWRAAYLVAQSYYLPDHLDTRGTQPPDDDPATGLAGFAMNDLRPADLRADSWTEAPAAKVLPDFWSLRLIRGGAVVYERSFDNPIPTPLHVGPAPVPTSGTGPGQMLDDDSEWLLDFSQAVKKGMAQELVISENDFALGFDRVILCGVKVSSNRVDSDLALLQMFASHRYTDGLRILRQGTPTHHTPDADSGENSKDPAYDASYATLGQDLSRMSPGSNGRRLTRFLGYSPFLFDRCENATLDELGPGGDLATVLWPASWGYFLAQMAPEGGLTGGQLDLLRRYFIEQVHARGILPSLQIGKKPYGLLPVTTLKGGLFKPLQDGSAEDLVYAQVAKLYPKWLAMAAQAPHLGRSSSQDSPDLDSDFTESLSMLPSSWTVRGRLAYGKTFLQNLFNFYGALMDPALRDDWWGNFYSLSADTLRELQYSFHPRVQDMVFQGASQPLLMDLVRSAPISPEDVGLAYLGELAAMTFFQLQDLKNEDPHTPWPLFKSILRHAFMLEYMRAAFRILDAQGLLGAARRVGGEPPEPEVVTDDPAFPDGVSLLNRLNTLVNGQKVVDYVATDDANTHYPDAVRSWREFRDSLANLNNVPTKDIERLFGETLDCCSHRLDAWISSFASRRLESMKPLRDDRHDAVLAAYAWAEDLRADASRTFVQDPVEGLVQTAPEESGYVQAPSLNQARTVAVLRNACLSHAGGAQEEAMTVNLSSERVRRARGYLDGVRQGQPLGALLGYRFERLLQDRYAAGVMEPYIQPFRDAFPLVDGKLTPDSASAAQDVVSPRNVVDGLALFRAWKGGSVSWGVMGLPQESDVYDALDQLDKDIDGLTDLGLAESVHQAVNGNPTRGGAMLDVIAAGALSPDPEVIRSPRSGCSLTHKVALAFNQAFVAPPGARARALAEPRLDAWSGQMFGDLTRLACTVSVTQPAPQDPPASQVLLTSLGLSSLDLVYVGGSELDALIRHAYRSSNGGLDASKVLTIDWSQPMAQGAGIRTIPDMLAMAKLLREIISASRALHAGDFSSPDQATETAPVSAADAAAFLIRGQASLADFAVAAGALPNGDTPLPAPPPDPDGLRRNIQQMIHFGITGAAPVTAGRLPADLDLLWTQAQSLRSAADKRQTAAQSALDAAATATRATDYIGSNKNTQAAFKAIFGQDFSVLPDVNLPNGQAVMTALQDPTALLDPADPLSPQRWFQQLGQVRSRLARYESSMLFAEAYQTGPSLDFRLVQFPLQSPDRWIGLPIDPGQQPQHGKVGVLTAMPFGVQGGPVLAGLALDEWAEEISMDKENTGIAFNFRQPGLEAPQCVLLAVPPDPAMPWTWEALMSVLSDTLDLAKIRGVDYQSMKGMGQYLPALYFASNPQNDTVSTDFFPDASKAVAAFQSPL